jgi:hypothetical protein
MLARFARRQLLFGENTYGAECDQYRDNKLVFASNDSFLFFSAARGSQPPPRTMRRAGARVALVVAGDGLAEDAELANSLSPSCQVAGPRGCLSSIGLPA